jgi:hypothetical protein
LSIKHRPLVIRKRTNKKQLVLNLGRVVFYSYICPKEISLGGGDDNTNE